MSSISDVIIASAVSFLIGFKIAAWLGKRQTARLRNVWRK